MRPLICALLIAMLAIAKDHLRILSSNRKVGHSRFVFHQSSSLLCHSSVSLEAAFASSRTSSAPPSQLLPGWQPQLTPSERGKIVFRAAPAKIDFEVVGSKIGRSPTFQEGWGLPSEVGRVLGAPGGGADIYDVAINLAFVLIFDCVHHIGVPE